MILWRISSYARLDGRGGLLASGRWHTQGRLIVYLAESAAGALAEALVHLELDPADLPPSYKLVKAEASDNLPIRTISASELPSDWTRNTLTTRSIGDRWLFEQDTALLRVPSAILPETWNVLLNPEHSQAKHVHVVSHREYPWDRRLLEKQQR